MKPFDAVSVKLRRLTLTLSFLMLLPFIGNAQYTPGSWPASFLDYTDSTGAYIQDVSDQSPPETDVFFSASTPSSVLVAADGTHAFFRFQVYADPYQPNGRWSSFAWVVAISNPTGQGAPIGWISVSASGATLDVTVKDQTTEDVIYTYAKTTANPGAIRSLPAGSSGNFYFDFQVPMAAITSRIGVTSSTPLRFFYGTSTSGGTINKDYMTGSAVSFLGLTTTTFTSITNGTLIPLPVELTSFQAYLKGSTAELRWSTATESNNHGFEVLRSVDHGEWTVQDFVQGAGNIQTQRDYVWNESVAGITGHIRYSLRQIDRDGSAEQHTVVELNSVLPTNPGLTAVYPQPATNIATVNYASSGDGTLSLTLHDLSGRTLRTVLQNAPGMRVSGSQTLDVSALPAGSYLLRLNDNGSISHSRLIISR